MKNDNEGKRKNIRGGVGTSVIRVYGIVQGVGFRPFVSRAADSIGITGSVANKGSYVEIYARGTDEQIERLDRELAENPPERAAVLKIDRRPHEDIPFDSFEIIESEKEAGDIFVSPDIATCPKCREELFDPNNRRYMHPFINCTACGPRLTILQSMPYDRQRTSMGEFPMCPECEYEYTHPETRRYDAQPVCCNDCGPEVYILDGGLKGREAITAVRKALASGKIAAVKGIGGFHLCCDATNKEAVARLRRLKNRPMKPFAVMLRSLETVYRECEVPEHAAEIIDGHQKPIVLLRKKPGGKLVEEVAPDNPKVGVMLPYAPLQMLLFDYNDGFDLGTDCLVMTSANISGAPICRTDDDARSELSDMCDIILSHNRKILIRADDSVMDFYRGEPYMIRRSRGYAPLPYMMSQPFRGSVLAVGGELKNTFCVAKNQLFYPSPYVGDMADIRTVKALEETIGRLENLLETEPELVACDLHPKYNTTEVAAEQGLPLFRVQHHYAHILSCMAENDFDGEVIGAAFDGTGYGTDGTIWGSEILRADTRSFDRLGHITPFRHVGGDLGVKQGWRTAASMINSIYRGDAPEIAAKLGLCSENDRKLIEKMAERGINTVTSTSAGRLFDAVSAITGIRREASYEGEMSVTLMFRAQEFAETQPESVTAALDEEIRAQSFLMPSAVTYSGGSGADGDAEGGNGGGSLSKYINIPADKLVKWIAGMKLSGRGERELAYIFHRALADQIISAVKLAGEMTGIKTAALSGGVFQNLMLLRFVDEGLQENGFKVLRHRLIPPNDGGIALGQALAAMTYLNDREKEIEREA
ncbi:MAG: carbamoyltransferase HypF [Anaerovoracaceae bacterium]|jgi:hydrogenase maturation protein HypF